MTDTINVLDRRICVLTKLLDVLRSAGTASASRSADDEPTLVDLYTHVAILLTRGDDKLGHGRRIVAVTGGVSKGVIEKNGRTSLLMLVLAQNSDPKTPVGSEDEWLIDSIDPPANDSWKVLKQQKITYHDIVGLGLSPNEPLLCHAQRVFSALKESAEAWENAKSSAPSDDLQNSVSIPLLHFILHSCYRKIRSRLLMDRNTIFRGQKCSFGSILTTWTPKEGDVPVAQVLGVSEYAVRPLIESWQQKHSDSPIPVPPLQRQDGQSKASGKPHGKKQYVLTQENSEFWVRTAGYTLNATKSRAVAYEAERQSMDRYYMETRTTKSSVPQAQSKSEPGVQESDLVADVFAFAGRLHLLWLLVRSSGGFFQTLLSIPSLRDIVTRRLQVPKPGTPATMSTTNTRGMPSTPPSTPQKSHGNKAQARANPNQDVKHDPPVGKTQETSPAIPPQSRDDAGEDSDDDELAPSILPEDSDPTEHVIRYLGNSVAWVSAVNTLPHVVTFRALAARAFLLTKTNASANEPDTTKASLVTAQASAQGACQVTDFANILNNLDLPGDIPNETQDRFSNVQKSKTQPCVHAEATLIGLLESAKVQASEPSSSPSDKDSRYSSLLQFFANSPVTAIGVSKRCCFCCDWLGAHLKYELPGTHGIIYPWSAPPGIPQQTLQALADDLRDILKRELARRIAAKCGNPIMSAHSSPAQSIKN